MLIASFAAASPGFGQDDLLGGGLFNDPDPNSRTLESVSEGETESSPLTRQLLMQASAGNQQLAQSVSALSRTGQWTEVDLLLRSIAVDKIPAEERANMAKRIGPTQYLRIMSQAGVSDQAKTTLSALAKSEIERTESPQRIAAAIKQLGSDDANDHAAAARVLFAGGNAAIGALADQLTQAQPITPADKLLPTYVRFGDGIFAPIQRYALYGDAARREKALTALGRLSPSQATLAALAAIYATDASDEERAIATQRLIDTYQQVPSLERVSAALTKDLLQKRDAALLMNRDGQTQTLWTLQLSTESKNQSLRSIKSTKLVAAYRDAADAAARLKRLGRHTAQAREAILAADLAYRVMVDPQWGSLQQINAIRESFGFDVDEALLMASVQRSVELGDDAATLGLLRWIASDDQLFGTQLLQHSGARETSLVRLATDSSVAKIRYEAALAVSALASRSAANSHGRVAYAGSSRVAKTLSEMLSLEDRPQAILVETRSEVIVSIEHLLTDLGFRVTVVPSVSRLLSEINAGGDLRLILAKTQLWDMPAIELVDRVRRLPRGRRVPIILYGDDEVRLGEDRWEAATVVIPQPATTAIMDEVLASTQRRSRLTELSALDRREFRRLADQWLSGTAEK
jgi:CheY-like chemotaxis protein